MNNNIDDIKQLQNKIYCKYLCPLKNPSEKKNPPAKENSYSFNKYMTRSSNDMTIFDKLVSFYIIHLPCKYTLSAIDAFIVYNIINVCTVLSLYYIFSYVLL